MNRGARTFTDSARDVGWHEAVERVWQAFSDRDYDKPTISPKELYEALEAVLAEERDLA